MSTELFEGEYVHINRYCGPKIEDEERLRWQVTSLSGHERGTYVQLTRLGMMELRDALCAILPESDEVEQLRADNERLRLALYDAGQAGRF